MPKPNNGHPNRESWLCSAADLWRPEFKECGIDLPELIRWAIAFTSHGKRGQVEGECWLADASGDKKTRNGIVRCDNEDAVTILSIMGKLLIKMALDSVKLDRAYRDIALRLGYDCSSGLKAARPGPRLSVRLNDFAAALGPLPHARIDWTNRAASDKPKKQVARMIKCECTGPSCGYVVRAAAKWLRDVGPPHCPAHGAMAHDPLPDGEEEENTAPAPLALPKPEGA